MEPLVEEIKAPTENAEEIIPDNNTETKVDNIETEVDTETENNVNEKQEDPELGGDDTADAVVVLEPVVEETQSQIAAESSAVEENITKEPDNIIVKEKKVEEPTINTTNYSPMETEDSKLNEIEKTAKSEVELSSESNEIKEPTPEPMEVDSSSKSNDDLEKMDEASSDDVVQPQISTPVEDAPQLAKEVENEQSTALVVDPSSTNASNLNNVNVTEENTEQNSLATDAIVTHASETVELNSLGAKLVNESAATDATAFTTENNTEEITTPPAANDSNKTENDLCM